MAAHAVGLAVLLAARQTEEHARSLETPPRSPAARVAVCVAGQLRAADCSWRSNEHLPPAFDAAAAPKLLRMQDVAPAGCEAALAAYACAERSLVRNKTRSGGTSGGGTAATESMGRSDPVHVSC